MPITFPREGSKAGPSSSASSSSSDSYPSSEASFDEEEERALIQEEWEESLRQMEVVMSICHHAILWEMVWQAMGILGYVSPV